MSMTANDIFIRARMLIDEYSDDGTVISDDDIADIRLNAIKYIDMAQRELYKFGKTFATYEFANKPIGNLAGSDFSIHEFEGTTLYLPSESGVEAKSYYIEADGTHTIEIQELESGSWSTLVTQTDTVVPFTAYKGNLTLTTSGNKVRIKISGTNYYRYRNACLYEFSFDTVPDFVAWKKVTLPSDFGEKDSVIIEENHEYINSSNYKWENEKDFYVGYYLDANIRINYKPIPTEITAFTDTMEVDTPTCQAIVYSVAAKLSIHEQPSLVNFFEGKMNEEIAKLNYDTPVNETEVENVYWRW